MKFRAVMIDAAPMREFTNIVQTISKLSKECVLRLADDQLYFIVSEENNGPAPPILWCEIPQAMFFSEYLIVGLDDEHKDIFLGVSSGNLARSLVTLKSAKSLKMKLTKKQCPCLTLEIEMPSSTSLQTRHVTHDIPVVVIPRKMWSDFQEPNLPNPDISIELPTLKQLRTTIDRMRTMAPEVVIRASAEGRLTLQIKTDMAKVSTRFKNLRVAAFEGPIEHSDSETETQANEDLSRVCHCRVDAKKLSMFLSADQISHNRTMCSVLHKKLVVIRASAEGRLTLQIKTDMAKVSTRFKNLRVAAFEGPIEHSDSETETQANEDLSRVCHCRVDAKKLSMFLSADQISHNRTMCSVLHKKLVILCLETEENVKLQCFISGIVY